jgi:hypothetical protein
MELELVEDIVLLEWSFTPKDYFEDEIRIEREDYETHPEGARSNSERTQSWKTLTS